MTDNARIIRPAARPALLRTTTDAFNIKHRCFKLGMRVDAERAGELFRIKIGRSWWYVPASGLEFLDETPTAPTLQQRHTDLVLDLHTLLGLQLAGSDVENEAALRLAVGRLVEAAQGLVKAAASEGRAHVAADGKGTVVGYSVDAAVVEAARVALGKRAPELKPAGCGCGGAAGEHTRACPTQWGPR